MSRSVPGKWQKLRFLTHEEPLSEPANHEWFMVAQKTGSINAKYC